MNRVGVALASGLVAVAALVLIFSVVRASRVHAHGRPAGAPATSAMHANAASSAGTPDQQDKQDQDDDGGPVVRFVKDPEPIPLFMARDIDGNVISTAAYKGKIVLIAFWATWCPPCREEIPELVRLQDEFKDQLQILSFSEDEASAESLRAFAKGARINYPIVLMTPEIEMGFGGIPALPTSFLINKDGGVMNKHVGLYPISVFEREIRALAGMQVDARIETFVDTGQVFLKNAANATELPGVDLSKLTPQQKQVVLKRLNSETCTCGCKLTLAECRINDTTCPVSRSIASKIVKEILEGKPAGQPAEQAAPAKPDDDSKSD